MPHSLRSRLSGLRHKKIISDKDYDRICKALDIAEGKVVYSDADSIKIRNLTLKEKEKIKAALNNAFGTVEVWPIIKEVYEKGYKDGQDENLISIQRLNEIRNYIVINIMRNPDIMFSDIRDNDVDPVEVIASLYEILHRIITGEPYHYMFHWANKCGSWVKDDLFTPENPENPENRS